MERNKTRYERRMARGIGIARIVGIVVCAALTLFIYATVFLAKEPEAAPEVDYYARFAAQEEYYRVMDLYGDAEGAVEAARMVFEREAPQ